MIDFVRFAFVNYDWFSLFLLLIFEKTFVHLDDLDYEIVQIRESFQYTNPIFYRFFQIVVKLVFKDRIDIL